MSKLLGLREAARLVTDGQTITVGGSLLQRSPAAFCRELARQGRHDLHLAKPSPGYDGDLLSTAGVLSRVSAGMVSLEQPHGIAPGFRRAVEQGRVEVIEHACISVASGLRAASLGIPFQPLRGLTGSDIPNVSGFLALRDPETGEQVWAVRAIRPDWAIVHVHQADSRGNARITGTPNWDPLMATAATGVIVTAEEIVPHDELARVPELTQISELNVRAVVHAPGGAWPGACHPLYDTDDDAVRDYVTAVRAGEGVAGHLDRSTERDRTMAQVAV